MPGLVEKSASEVDTHSIVVLCGRLAFIWHDEVAMRVLV